MMRKIVLAVRYRCSSNKVSTIEQAFKERSLLYQMTSQQLASQQFLQQHQGKAVYCGYDPTSESLHLGNLVSIIMMARLSMMGLRPIFLVGGATGLIGDPSGKSKERPLLQEGEITRNIEKIESQIKKVYGGLQTDLTNNHKQYHIAAQDVDLSYKHSFMLKNNYQFYEGMNAVRYLRDLGKYFRMSTLLARETVAQRLKSEEGISYAEFSYSIIQAYDYLRLFEEEQCVLQFGGSDQWGNIANGCDLIRKKTGKQAFGVTMPLLLTKSGAKFGKSQGNALFLNAEKTPLSDVYQYFYNSADDQVQRYLRIFTFHSGDSIAEIMKKHDSNKEKRFAQSLLAETVVSYLGKHNRKEAEIFRLTHDQLKAKSRQYLLELFSQMKRNGTHHYTIDPTALLELTTGEKKTGLLDLLLRFKLAKSKTEGRRQVEKGGLYINNRNVQLSQLNIPLSQLLQQNALYGQFIVLRWGKKHYQFLQLGSD